MQRICFGSSTYNKALNGDFNDYGRTTKRTTKYNKKWTFMTKGRNVILGLLNAKINTSCSESIGPFQPFTKCLPSYTGSQKSTEMRPSCSWLCKEVDHFWGRWEGVPMGLAHDQCLEPLLWHRRPERSQRSLHLAEEAFSLRRRHWQHCQDLGTEIHVE